MLRKAAIMLALTVVGLVALPTLAFGYPAPPVTPGGEPGDPATTATTSTTDLASTGAGFSVGTAVAIGALILIVGLAMVLLGNRLRKSNG